ncbi:hypothetical protein HW49_05085 [Porphyromonadaceae bacterium COT-184 OH4590]|nr:hypothetical protein HW49_05085 [Porphyromonadaceae bacterium COT-184 OH4590]
MYKVSQNIDPNKIFIINRSELIGRFDVTYYSNKFDFCNTIKLQKVAKIKGGKRIPKEYNYSNEETDNLYLRVVNLEEDKNFNYSEFKFISDALYDRLKRYEVFENELIISIAGTIGKTKVLKNIPSSKRIILTENCAKIITSNDLSPEYLNLVLQTSFLQKQISASYIQTTIPKLGIDKILELRIPVIPSIETQHKVVDFYNQAYTQKQQKEAEAQRLLDSIDDYLLGELGIVLPNEDDLQMIVPNHHYGYALNIENPLVKNGRLFLTSVKEVSGGRFDVKNYGAKTLLLKKSIQNIDSKKFKTEPLKYFVIQSVAGDWGKEGNDTEEIENYEKCLVIRTTEFDNNYNLNLENSRVKYRYIKRSKLAKIDIRENDLLIEKSGGSLDQPVGRIAIITNDILANNKVCYSNFIHKIRVNNQLLLPEYLFCYLKTIHNIKITEAMQSQTNGIRNLIMNTYLKQDIVIPINEKGRNDLKKQQEIANNIQKMRIKALQLQTEANQILEQTKQQIEQMILGS